MINPVTGFRRPKSWGLASPRLARPDSRQPR